MKLKELATRLGAELNGPGDADITGVAGVYEAREGQITYVLGEQNIKDLENSRASACIVPVNTPELPMPTVRVKNPKLAFARALSFFHGKTVTPLGISEQAVIGKEISIGKTPSIHPFAVVADRALIGDRVTLYPGVYVGEGSAVGDDSVIYPNVSIREGVTIGKRVIIHPGAVIGSDGFGFVTDGGEHHKIPQVGGVIIGDDVEIGSNCTIDRATLGNTVIKKGTKIDNLVHIAHNVTVGEHCLLAGTAAVAGSSTLGNYVVLGGSVSVSDHVTLGDRVIVTGGTGVMKDTAAGQIVGGYYAMPHREWLKVQAVLPKLPELKKLVVELERHIKELKK